MKVFVVFALISTLAVSVYGQDMSCEQLESNAELGLRRLLLIENGAEIPKTEADLQNRCK